MANRIEVLKTYKIYIGGQFPRTESGRYYSPEVKGKSLGNICLSSRKDLRNAVTAASSAQTGWSSKTAFNKAQILYRIAELLEDRSEQFIAELRKMGIEDAKKEVERSIDRIVYYAGWCDKYQHVFSSVNPVSSSFFNFSVLEPTGVIAIICPEKYPLLGLVSTIMPVIAGGNTVVALASESKPLSAISFAEVLNSSDVPAGVVNIITGKESELIFHFCSHMEIQGLLYTRDKTNLIKIEADATENMKRVKVIEHKNWHVDSLESPYQIIDHQEVKTTWHPIMPSGSGSSAY